MHQVVILSGLSYPTGCFLCMIYSPKSTRLVYLLIAIGSALGGYIVLAALLSPTPPLANSPLGGHIMVAAWISFTLILSYAKTMATF